MPFIVLDHSVCRKRDLWSLVRASRLAGSPVALPEVTLLEIMRSADPLVTASRSLAEIAKEPARAIGLRTLPELLRAERDTGASRCGNVRSEEQTVWIRRLLAAVRRKERRPLERLAEAAPEVLRDYKRLVDDNGNRSRLLEWVSILENAIGAAGVQQLRRGAGGMSALVSTLQGHVGEGVVRSSLLGVGDSFAPDVAHHLSTRLSVAKVVAFERLIHAAVWVAEGGLEGLGAAKFTNEYLDSEYVVYGALGGELLTRDSRMIRRHRILQAALSQLPPASDL